jgi:hypothetical protein
MHCTTSIGALSSFKHVQWYIWCFVCWNHKQCIALGWSWRGQCKSILEQWLDVEAFPNLRLQLFGIMIRVNSKGLMWNRLLYFGSFMWMHCTTSIEASGRYSHTYDVLLLKSKQCITLGWSWRGLYKSLLEKWLDVKTFLNLRLELLGITIKVNLKGLIWTRLLYLSSFIYALHN